MKKLSILLIGLLLVTGFAFAADPEVSASASVTWGVDLDTGATGFVNASASDITITWFDDVDFSAAGEDNMYGSITLEGVSWELTASGGFAYTAGDVTATIYIDPVTVTIFSAPTVTWDYAPTIEDTNEASVAGDLTGANAIGGLTISIPVSIVTIDAKVASNGDWTDNANNDYLVGADFSVDLAPITLTLGTFYGFLATPDFGVGAKAELSLADVMSGLDAWVGFDGALPNGGDFDYDVAGGLTLALSPDNADGDSSDVVFETYAYFGTQTTDPDVDMSLSWTEPETDGVMDMLGATVTFELLDLLAGAPAWNLDVEGNYNTGDLNPYFGFGYGSDSIFDLKAGVELYEGFTGIDLTTITIDYTSTDVSTDNGIITVKAEVEL